MADNEKKLTEDRIKELEAQLQAVEATHTAQAKRGDELEKRVKDLNAKLKVSEAHQTARPTGNHVVLAGKTYAVLDTFRADNTFVEVKKGHCDEGITLVAIQKVF